MCFSSRTYLPINIISFWFLRTFSKIDFYFRLQIVTYATSDVAQHIPSSLGNLFLFITPNSSSRPLQELNLNYFYTFRNISHIKFHAKFPQPSNSQTSDNFFLIFLSFFLIFLSFFFFLRPTYPVACLLWNPT